MPETVSYNIGPLGNQKIKKLMGEKKGQPAISCFTERNAGPSRNRERINLRIPPHDLGWKLGLGGELRRMGCLIDISNFERRGESDNQ